ncbi:uncharacterized protein LOC124160932 [Ischnura elegans]|uniref:uncharacterized protein LOC124160932 n=1 Tax=Ischnura elegans TaxID=197161 RepID=UPI001ED88284|nr:uncharacterized protein LOC124160932 [Ischnura elegans]
MAEGIAVNPVNAVGWKMPEDNSVNAVGWKMPGDNTFGWKMAEDNAADPDGCKDKNLEGEGDHQVPTPTVCGKLEVVTQQPGASDSTPEKPTTQLSPAEERKLKCLCCCACVGFCCAVCDVILKCISLVDACKSY